MYLSPATEKTDIDQQIIISVHPLFASVQLPTFQLNREKPHQQEKQ